MMYNDRPVPHGVSVAVDAALELLKTIQVNQSIYTAAYSSSQVSFLQSPNKKACSSYISLRFLLKSILPYFLSKLDLGG